MEKKGVAETTTISRTGVKNREHPLEQPIYNQLASMAPFALLEMGASKLCPELECNTFSITCSENECRRKYIYFVEMYFNHIANSTFHKPWSWKKVRTALRLEHMEANVHCLTLYPDRLVTIDDINAEAIKLVGHQEALRIAEMHGISMWVLKSLLNFDDTSNKFGHADTVIQRETFEEAELALADLNAGLDHLPASLAEYREGLCICLQWWISTFWNKA